MKLNPLVSVIMPVYNTERYVREAIDSVLAQTYRPLELICVNDGSTDHSLEIIQSYATAYSDVVRCIDLPKNSGIAEARNTAIRVAQGEYLAFMDADDVWKSGKISAQMERFIANPVLHISFTHIQCFISPDLSEEVKRTRFCPPDPMPGYISPTAMVRRDFFDTVGAFNPKWRVGEFIDWYARAQSMDVVSDMIPEVYHLRRIHATNTGVTERPSRGDYVKIMRELLDRKRDGKKKVE